MKRMLQAAAILVVAILASGRSALGFSESPTAALSWIFQGSPTASGDVAEIAVDPEQDNLWYVATPTGMFVTWSGGESWTLGFEGNVGAVAIDPNDPAVVYASAGSDLYWSLDHGDTWNRRFAFPEVIPGTPTDASTFIDSILVSSSAGTLVVGLTATPHSARVYSSTDQGETWDIVFESPSGLHIWDLAEIPSSGTWFFCTEDSSHLVNPVVMRSKDRGATWEEMLPLTGVPSSGHGLNLAVHPWSEIVYFLQESTVLRYSTDSGDTWSHDYAGRGFGGSLLLDANCPNRVFGGEMLRGLNVGGVFVSEDSARYFTFSGLAGHTISSLAINGASTRLFAASYGSGIWTAGLQGTVPCSTAVLLFADDFEEGSAYRWSVSVGRRDESSAELSPPEPEELSLSGVPDVFPAGRLFK